MKIAIAYDITTITYDKQHANKALHNKSLSFVQRPAVDGALGVLEELVLAIFWMRQTYGQSFNERTETHDAAGLLVVKAQPAAPFGVERILLQRLMQSTQTT